MIMPFTLRVKERIAKRTVIIAIQVFINGHFILTNATKDCLCAKFILLPNLMHVICLFLVAAMAGIIVTATFKLYTNHIKQGMVMDTPCIFINKLAFDPARQFVYHCNEFSIL